MRTRTRIAIVAIATSITMLVLGRSGTAQGSPITRFILIVSAGVGIVILSLRIGRNLSLRDRRVGRRLTVLMVVAVVVPVLLVGTIGAFSSWIGTASDRALAAAREYAAESARLHDELTVALAHSGDADSRLRDVEAAHARRGEALIVWVRRSGWSHLSGAGSLEGAATAAATDTAAAHGPDSTAIAAWGDSARSVTVLTFEGQTFVTACAAAPDSARGAAGRPTAIALIPIRGALSADVSKRVGARLAFQGAATRNIDFLTGRFEEATRQTVTEIGLNQFSPFLGFATFDGLQWQRDRWVPASHMIAVSVEFMPWIRGLVRNAMVTPIAFIPIALLVFFLLLGVRVLLVAGGMLRAIERSVTGAVAALRDGVTALQAGRLEYRIPISGSDELWDVASGFNQAAEGLERGRQLERERERAENEMEVARRIHARLLPASAPDAPGLEIAGLSRAALAVGGDYYDHVALGDGRVALVVADVSGKGVPAALLMSGFRASLLSQLDAHADPARALERVNRFLHRSVESGRFVTAFLAVVDGRDGAIHYCNAGHNAPLLVAADGRVTPLETGGLLLGMMEEARYESGSATLEAGATLVLYTDGVVEAQGPDGTMWGDERLADHVRGMRQESCARAAEDLATAVRAFEGERGPSDDLTLVFARRSRQ